MSNSHKSSNTNHEHNHDHHANHEHNHETHIKHEHNHDHHAMMVEDFKKRFFISIFLTIPILILSPMIQMFMGVDFRFNGDTLLLFALSMTFSTGIKSAFDYSVFTASAAAFALSLLKTKFLELK